MKAETAAFSSAYSHGSRILVAQARAMHDRKKQVQVHPFAWESQAGLFSVWQNGGGV